MAGLGNMVGPSYPYWNNIYSPAEIGMSANGDMNTLGNDINGLIAYVEVLVQGNSSASKTGGPLGNKFFLQTAAKCTPQGGSGTTSRYIYTDNVPSGALPFVSSGMGTNFTDARGLIPGAMGDLNVLNPGNLFT